jgi:hypothetical protein
MRDRVVDLIAGVWTNRSRRRVGACRDGGNDGTVILPMGGLAGRQAGVPAGSRRTDQGKQQKERPTA